jgi:hypothetical protein
MLYETLLLIGAVGLLAQTVLGMAGHGGHGHDHGGAHAHGIDFELPHGHMGHAGPVSGHPGAATAPAAPGHGASHCQANGHSHVELTVSQRAATALWTLFSPLTIFSVCVGAGATGILTRAMIGKPLFVALAAIVGGVLFYSILVKPLWGLIFKFASKPAETLSGAVAREAVATGRFDADGQGIVRVTIDGEYVRLLARLDREDREKGIAVLSGDKLVVTSVDEKRNRCIVTRL